LNNAANPAAYADVQPKTVIAREADILEAQVEEKQN
jgi:hypothetical protein